MTTELDIKIYGAAAESVSEQRNGDGEVAATLFLRHKNCGNIEKTKQMGKLLAATFDDTAHRFTRDLYRDQKLTLISFLLNDELQAGIQDEILRQSVISNFQKDLEKKNGKVFDVIIDSAAYTVYILEERKRTGIGIGVGSAFANLCGLPDNTALAEEANDLELEYRRLFHDIIESYVFENVTV